MSLLKKTYWYIKQLVQSNWDKIYLDRYYYLFNKEEKVSIDFYEITDFKLEQHSAIEACFLFSTKNRGIIYFENNRLYNLFSCKNAYGLTYHSPSQRWFAFVENDDMFGSIISFQFTDGRAHSIRTVIKNLSRGIHQIDFLDDNSLFVTDTYFNSVLIYEINEKTPLDWRKYRKRIFPNGRLSISQGRRSENYSHFNSIFQHQSRIYLIAHNESVKTGKQSELFILDQKLNLIERKTINGKSCHNIFLRNEEVIILDSLGENLLNNNQARFHYPKFLRGLSVTKDEYIIGGSALEKNKQLRKSAESAILITNKEFTIKAVLNIPNCQIHDIRSIGVTDFSLSLS